MPSWNSYDKKNSPDDVDTLMIKDNVSTGNPNRQLLFSKLWDWVMSKTYAFTQGTKSIPAAINELKTATETDSTLSTSGKAADAKATGDSITTLTDAVNDTIENISDINSVLAKDKELFHSAFIHGSIDAHGTYYSNYSYRIVSKNAVTFEKPTLYLIASGFRIRPIACNKNSGEFVSVGVWTTGTYTFGSGTDYQNYSYKVIIGRVTEDTSEIADINLFKKQLYIPTGIDTTDPSEYSYYLSNIEDNIARNIAVNQGWLDIPGTSGGVFTNRRFSYDYDVQTYTELGTGTVYNRIVKRLDRSVYRGWKTGIEDLITDVNELSAKVTEIDNTSSSEYSYLLSNISGEKAYNVALSQGWLDLPATEGGVFFNHQFANNFDIQTYTELGTGTVYNRIVRRTNRAIYRDWKTYTEPVMGLNVLVLGDSICRGGRNAGRGFIGDIGCNYVNIGVGGASISTKVDSSQSTDSVHPMAARNIPDQLVKYSQQTEEDWYIVPDAIIAEGGINDYLRNAPLGTIPTQPITTDEEAEALDKSTLTGSLQYLFYQMIKLYYTAHRFFLITNKVTTYPWTVHTSGGYTQTELHDAIVAVCALYGVMVIDVFKDSFIDSTHSQYISPTNYRNDPSITNQYHIDHDALHPLALGYRTGYAPLVKEALKTAVDL